MQRVLCCVLCLLLILALAAPVSAAESGSAWIELLRFGNVNGDDDNFWQMPSGEFTCWVPTPFQIRCCKIDMVLTHTAGTGPSKVELEYNGSYYTLTTQSINSTTTRIYGDIPDTLYAHVYLRFTRSSTASSYYELLSCRVTQLDVQDTPLDAYVLVDGTRYYCPFNASFETEDTNITYHMQFPIVVTDWQKYDSLTFVGSISAAALNSVRVSIGGVGVPYEITYTNSNPSGTNNQSWEWSEWKYYNYDESYKGTTEGTEFTYTEYIGKTLYCITVDLSNVDRNSTQDLACYFTCLVSGTFGYDLQVIGATGSILPADTSEVTWWNRFTTFMTELFAGSSSTTNKMEQVQEQSQELAEDRLGAVYQAGQVVDGLVGAFQNQTATEYLTVPVLTVPLGEVDWTIGGWEVQVVPDAFKPIVEILKTVIDIVCTLAFLKSMRARFEKLLVGGNA